MHAAVSVLDIKCTSFYIKTLFYTLSSRSHRGWEGDVLCLFSLAFGICCHGNLLFLYVCEHHMGHATYLRLSRNRTCFESSL